MAAATPEFILYAQHGWADTGQRLASLAAHITDSQTIVVAPSLGFVKTWIRIEPLIQAVEAIVLETSIRYPETPMRIIGHSMGGLIWLELLSRYPDWCSRVESLVLVGSPIGGSDWGRMLDPLGWGIGIARDLGINRRILAEAIVAQIPTLVIAGDVDGGSDGTITVESTKVFGASFVSLPGVSHAALRDHPLVAEAIQQFWAIPKGPVPLPPEPDLAQLVIKRLQTVPGMTDAHQRDFAKATVYLTFEDGATLRVWKHPLGMPHIFVASPEGTCLYGGFVGWQHVENLDQILAVLQQEQAAGFLD
jgi:pimeloyl-ACP methyl ester carboxylesterase